NSIVLYPHAYVWEGDRPLKRQPTLTGIYEKHGRGFTQHPNSRDAYNIPSTDPDLLHKIPHLRDFGTTAAKAFPVTQFDSSDAALGLVNYWGYAPVSFFAPHRGYSSRQDPMGPADEFRDMVKALHRAGIEVILDVLFNHTAEGDHRGPTISFRGLD